MTFPDPLDALIPKNCNSIFCRSLRPGQPRGPRVTLSGILRGPSIEPFLAEEGSLVRAPPVQSPSTAHTVECLTNMRGRIWSPWKTSPPEMSPASPDPPPSAPGGSGLRPQVHAPHVVMQSGHLQPDLSTLAGRYDTNVLPYKSLRLLALFCQHESVYMLQDSERHPNVTVFHPSHLACAGTPWPSNLVVGGGGEDCNDFGPLITHLVVFLSHVPLKGLGCGG